MSAGLSIVMIVLAAGFAEGTEIGLQVSFEHRSAMAAPEARVGSLDEGDAVSDGREVGFPNKIRSATGPITQDRVRNSEGPTTGLVGRQEFAFPVRGAEDQDD